MDKNSTIGIVLISAILLAYFTFFAPKPEEQKPEPVTTTTITPKEDVKADSLKLVQKQASYGQLATSLTGEEKDLVIENDDLKLVLSTKGGRIKEATLKNYKTSEQQPVVLLDTKNNHFNVLVPIAGKEINLSDLYFQSAQTSNAKQVIFTLKDADGSDIQQTYTLAEKGFVLEYNLKVNGQAISNPIVFDWKEDFKHTEADLKVSRTAATVNWYTSDESYKSLKETSNELEEEKVEGTVKWIDFKSKFFSTGFISENIPLQNVAVSSVADLADSNIVKTFTARFAVPAADLAAGKGNFKLYLGPNQYNIVKEVTEGFRHNVYLGWPVIRDVNRFVIYPLFTLVENFSGNYGLVILLLVLIVKTILLPLSYRAYMSMAKIRVLKPEIDEIKEKFPDDMQGQQQEQMKLYSSVGVNPLAGCVPVLLQMPILIAMFNLFPNLIELRQQAFLWAPDLSTYDAFFNLPFEIPFMGSHISLFTILMTASTIFYTWYNSQMSTQMTGPMQTLQYIMPITFMFILNSLPAGLTYYYFVSNLVTIAQQFAIKQMVDENQIRAKLDTYRATAATGGGPKKSRFQQRIEDAMKAQEDRRKTSTKKK